VADRIRAVPFSRRRPSLRVDSCVRMRPIRGNTTWWRSGSIRIAPVVNRTERAERCLDLNRGNPVGVPTRSPARDTAQFSNARARASSPEL
jgi:hypothetical protein